LERERAGLTAHLEARILSDEQLRSLEDLMAEVREAVVLDADNNFSLLTEERGQVIPASRGERIDL